MPCNVTKKIIDDRYKIKKAVCMKIPGINAWESFVGGHMPLVPHQVTALFGSHAQPLLLLYKSQLLVQRQILILQQPYIELY